MDSALGFKQHIHCCLLRCLVREGAASLYKTYLQAAGSSLRDVDLGDSAVKEDVLFPQEYMKGLVDFSIEGLLLH